jgi:hypothetical protein
MRWLILFVLLTVVGCEDRFRYPCQDPANAGNPECQEAACKATPNLRGVDRWTAKVTSTRGCASSSA